MFAMPSSSHLTRNIVYILTWLALVPLFVDTFNNPVLWHDLADLDILRVDDAYYYSASTMHYSPGAPILRSYDLVNWEYIGHSVPTLDFGSNRYNLAGGQAYVKGIWASWLGYIPASKTWYWGGCIESSRTYIYKATAVTGPWTQQTVLNKCYYDSGIFVDEDGTLYISYAANNQIWVAQMNAGLTAEVKSQRVFTPPSDVGYLEGTRMYKRDGVYYILLTKPPNGTYMLKGNNPFGLFTLKKMVLDTPSPVSGSGHPHQGALIEFPNGNWSYMSFLDAYPGGRIPVLAPITWGSDGFPAVTLVNGAWASSYSDLLPVVPVTSLTGRDTFTTLSHQYEWNHNPDTSKYSVGSGLTLSTATITNDLYAARNTLSRRIGGPISTATIQLNYTNMKDGDRSGLAILRDSSAWVGVRRDSGTYTVAFVTSITMDSNWNTSGTGTTTTSIAISGGIIYLSATADIAPAGTKKVTFKFSTDGETYNTIGTFTMGTDWHFFMGHRFAIFNYATTSLGGSVTVPWLQLDPDSNTPTLSQ